MLDRNQINIVHTNLADGRCLTRLIHLPSGCYAESFGTREPIIRMMERLIQELEAKVSEFTSSTKPGMKGSESAEPSDA
jgi:hypothetical protein